MSGQVSNSTCNSMHTRPNILETKSIAQSNRKNRTRTRKRHRGKLVMQLMRLSLWKMVQLKESGVPHSVFNVHLRAVPAEDNNPRTQKHNSSTVIFQSIGRATLILR